MNEFVSVDINADVGEGIGNEPELMPFLTSCSIACGGHAGDLQTMTNVVQLAKSHKVKIGAHPSFPDLENFGREIMEMSAADLYTSIKHQIRLLQTVLHNEHAQLHHIKPHGALYNLANRDEKTARVIVEVIKSIASPIKLYAPYNSVVANLAANEGVTVKFEAFADRNYNEDLTLVSRANKNAVLESEKEVLNHVLNMVKHQKVRTVNGTQVAIKASTFCVHSDTKNALNILRHLTSGLHENHIKIQ